LGIEEQFYIAWPLFLWLSRKSKFKLLTITLLATCASFILNIKGVNQNIVSTFYSPQTRFWGLLCGSLLAWITLHKSNSTSLVMHKLDVFSRIVNVGKSEINERMISNMFAYLGFLLLAYGFYRINKTLSFPGVWALIPVIGATLIIAAGSASWVNTKILSNKVVVWFGLISFTLYLWHWPILSFARIIESEIPSYNIRLAAIVLSIMLAWVTYKFVEHPIRFSKNNKVVLTLLIMFMTSIGLVGYDLFSRDGYEFRVAIKGYPNNKQELVRTPATDEGCLDYIGIKNPLFPYCRFTNVHSKETFAVIGDSHAHVAYPGISEYLSNRSINTVLLANSGCPPFVGSYIGSNQSARDACKDRIEQILAIVSSHDDIKKVLIFTRGTIYSAGTEPLTGDKKVIDGSLIPAAKLASSAQISINRLSKSGKIIFYVTENPELNYSAESCLDRPFKSVVRNCAVDKTEVLKRQYDYLKEFNKLENVKVIDSLSIFCPNNKCIVFDENGALLYADDDHLSVAGSKFQAKKLLEFF
jgi:hypothetical protein